MSLTEWTRNGPALRHVSFILFSAWPMQLLGQVSRGPKGDDPLLISVARICDPLDRHAAAAAQQLACGSASSRRWAKVAAVAELSIQLLLGFYLLLPLRSVGLSVCP